MHARTLHFLSNVFLTRRFRFFSFLLLLSWHANSAEPPIAQDTTSPNVFWFTSEIYTVEEDATNAIVTVEFSPGDRSWSGWVNYSVSNGTATAGQDYTSVSGTLFFSGPGTPVPRITIPVYKDSLREGDETVQLFLWNTNAIITRSTATLVIVDKNQNPRLEVSSGGNNSLVLSWPADFSDFALEKSDDLLTGSWIPVSSPKNISNGFCQVTESISNPPMFYRLKRTVSP
jgi:hypothetical protein